MYIRFPKKIGQSLHFLIKSQRRMQLNIQLQANKCQLSALTHFIGFPNKIGALFTVSQRDS